MTLVEVGAFRLCTDHYSIDMLWPFLAREGRSWLVNEIGLKTRVS